MVFLSLITFTQDYRGVYSGKIKCLKKEFEVVKFIHKSSHNFFYVKYQEFSKRKNELLAERYGKGTAIENTYFPGVSITKVIKFNEDNLYMIELNSVSQRERGDQMNSWRFNFRVPGQIGVEL